MKVNPLLWIVPEKKGGIRSYSEMLASFFDPRPKIIWELPETLRFKNDLSARIIHVQHEFGLFGSKLPGRYLFPKWMKEARRESPDSIWIATAHTVLGQEWIYPYSGSFYRRFLNFLLNTFIVPFARNLWRRKTWGNFHGVIVHSRHQVDAVRESGCANVEVIPHFVPDTPKLSFQEYDRAPVIVLFGYFSLEKGQDIAIRAWAELGSDAPKLILAGGVRRSEDQAYFDSCLSLIRKHSLEDRIEVTGFVPNEKVTEIFRKATLVLAPFRETNGSGSLATALGYGAAILASNLPLNAELNERVPACLELFDSEDIISLSKRVKILLKDEKRRNELRQNACSYAKKFRPQEIALLHANFYEKLLKDAK